MSRKQVVSLTSAILMIALITNIAGWIHHAEAHPDLILTLNVTHSCVDTDHPYQSDICQTVLYPVIVETDPVPHPENHNQDEEERDEFWSTGVTSCPQCPNPPFDEYN